MSSKEIVVISCASGKQATPLIYFLAKNPYRLRLVVHSTSSQQRLQKSYPEADVRTAELTNPSVCQEIIKDANIVYHIGPSLHPHETAIGCNMIDAAKSTPSVKHFIYSSVLNSQLRKLMNHDCKRYVEEYLMESELPYTILCPTHFMDVLPIPMFLKQMEENREGALVFPAMWNPDIKFSFLSLQDFAEAAFTVIKGQEKHFRAKYDIVSTKPLSYNEVLKKVGDVLGREIKAEQKPYGTSVSMFGARVFGGKIDGADPAMVDGLERLLLYYNRHGLQGNPNVLEWLIGRKPTSHEEWAKGVLGELKKA
ncbi:NAD(P)-binding protein [Mollisia scopiformis]|uniref:NAD(P)-binding protein n=1 Tax=Mollisia scopiformis TaxID=149040 RepID=A0A194WWR6_MOLSC|nr:NAD(P)-binding protein [Mollisia scopiformis]KUJ12385.1 NAD(P)-binding protein [Mollisia scopiformis]